MRLIIVCLLFLLSCDRPAGSPPRPAGLTGFSGDEAGLQQLAKALRAEPQPERSAALLAAEEDLGLLFTPEGLRAFDRAAYQTEAARLLRTNRSRAAMFSSSRGETELLVQGATPEAVRSGREKRLPLGMNRIAGHLRPELTFYTVRYVTPGDDLGSSYTAFVAVAGRWYYLPEPWRFFN